MGIVELFRSQPISHSVKSDIHTYISIICSVPLEDPDITEVRKLFMGNERISKGRWNAGGVKREK